MKLTCTVAALFFLIASFAQQITITEHNSFHDASWGALGALENVSTDNGGVLTFFIRNNDTLNADSIINVRFNVAGTYYDSVYWRAWPYVIAPLGQGNNYCAVTVKGVDFPFRENDTLTIEVWSANGGYASLNVKNVTQKLRTPK